VLSKDGKTAYLSDLLLGDLYKYTEDTQYWNLTDHGVTQLGAFAITGDGNTLYTAENNALSKLWKLFPAPTTEILPTTRYFRTGKASADGSVVLYHSMNPKKVYALRDGSWSDDTNATSYIYSNFTSVYFDIPSNGAFQLMSSRYNLVKYTSGTWIKIGPTPQSDLHRWNSVACSDTGDIILVCTEIDGADNGPNTCAVWLYAP
jgi:hypothetical protein